MADRSVIAIDELMRDIPITPKQEEWKYTATKLNSLIKKPYHIVDASALQDIIHLREGCEAFIRCVFINGVYFSSLSDALPDEVTITEKTGLALDSDAALIQVSGKVDERATFVEIVDQVVIEKPLYFYHVTTGNEVLNNTRLAITVGKNSIATICEHHVGKDAKDSYWTNRVQTITVASDAQCDHYLIQSENIQSVFTSITEVNLASKARYDHTSVTLGAALTRHEVHTHIRGKHCESDMKGLFLGKGQQQSDYYLPTTHHSSDSVSRQKIYGVLDDQAQGTFYGKVIVPKASQRTASHQMNRNVLLSPKAHVNSRPELEVYADDVQCSHGSATGALDAMALYYLQARGLNKEHAQQMLVDGFMYEIINAVKHDTIREIIETEVATWLKQ